MPGRIVVVANRLPVRKDAGGKWETSPGGLVSALVPVLQRREGCWIGWPGTPDDAPKPFVHEGIEQHPVAMTAEELETFYEGFCNGTLWPLYHDAIRTTEFHRHWWRPYAAINERFAQAAARVLKRGDVAWVQDYHLQLVPAMLRTLVPGIRIGFYLHTPFPPVELFGRLPWRREVLDGVLGADVAGFQTRLASANFARAAERYADARGSAAAVQVGRHAVRLQTAPVAIDTARYDALARSAEVVARAKEIRQELGGPRTVMLGVDRLDYTKGIDIRLKAFETLLERHPRDASEFAFVQIAVPSRERVSEYSQIRVEIEQIVGRINGRFATGGRSPVHYLYRNLSNTELSAYYVAADVMVVTPLRDGMNLVAQEYVASRTDSSGVLVLSEFAGSANVLRQALLVNPYDVDGVAATLDQAVVAANPDDMRRRMSALRRHVFRRDVYAWADDCLAALEGR